MRMVTQILALSQSRSKIYLEDEFAFVLYKGELRLYHIKEQTELAEQDYQTIMTEVLPKRAKLRAMHLLKDREYTQAQLCDKLKQQFYPQNIIEEAIDYVKAYHYVDDARYAEEFVRCHLNTRSRRRIEQDLTQKGISRETIEAAFVQWEPEALNTAEYDGIRRLLEKKRYRSDTLSFEEEQKLLAFLYRKGYAQEKARYVMKNYDFFV